MPRGFRLDAVLFDFDGTLTRPGAIDFDGLKQALAIAPGTYALEHLSALEPGPERDRALAILHRFEVEGAERSEPNDGAEDIVAWLREAGLPMGMITRNTLSMVERALENFRALSLDDFDVIVTRDTPVPFKPEPDTILFAAAELGVPPERCAMVGDFVVDVEAGNRAGAVTVHLVDPEDPDLEHHEPRFKIHHMDELREIVRLGRPLVPGKLPADLLERHLSGIVTDPSVLIGAATGQDVAVLDVAGAELLVAHPDPITLASVELARSSVLVNANDIATSGAEPRWFLATVLFPVGTTGSEALGLLADLSDECRVAGVSLVGGHTEVTDAVSRAVVSGAMFGTLAGADLRDKSGVEGGDALVFTQRVAVEGTALLGRELAEVLERLGFTPAEFGDAAALGEQLSVLPAARVARRFSGVRAMHDVTEGGFATAVRELATACGRDITLDLDSVPVYPVTQRMSGLLGMDPMGLIGSGSLLLSCGSSELEALLAALASEGIEASVVGSFGEAGGEVRAIRRDAASELPVFEVDEAARVLGGLPLPAPSAPGVRPVSP